MKRLLTSSGWLIALLVLALILVACERPIREDPSAETPQPGTDGGPATLPSGTQLVPPTPQLQPTGESGYPAPDATQPSDGTTDQATEATPPPEGTSVPTEDFVYTVVAGDTLQILSERFGVSVDAIAAANNLANVNTLEVGQQLLIPVSGDTVASPTEAPVTEERIHIVQPGDNLYRLGLQYGFTIQELATYNNLANPNQLSVGQEIRIPPDDYQLP